ncbi:unnamed protein product, partial [Chrysoparadoxa australica]
MAAAKDVRPCDPKTLKEALDTTDAVQWQAAVDSELSSLRDMEVYEVVEEKSLPRGTRVLSSKLILKTKYGADGELLKHKARLVVRGFEQRPGIDFVSKYSPVIGFGAARLIFSMACSLEWELEAFDVVTAFLHGKLKETVYVRPPKGCEKPGNVWRLRRALYGLVQAPQAFSETVVEVLTSVGLTRSKVDPNLFYRTDGNKVKCVIACYVDDGLMSYEPSYRSTVDSMMDAIRLMLKIKRLGAVESFLGWKVQRTKGTLRLSQRQAVLDLLSHHSVELGTLREFSTPAVPGTRLSPLSDGEQVVDIHTYRSVCGSLLYIAMCTRPDIATAVREVCKHVQAASMKHWQAVRRICGYLKGTADYGLTYNKGDPKLTAFCDASYASADDQYKSVSGFVAVHGGAAISWFSRLQRVTAQSTAEAEYIAMAEAAKELLYLAQLSDELGMDYRPIPLLSDCQSALFVALNAGVHRKVKHIGVRFHLIRESIASGDIQISYIPTGKQTADILTKALPLLSF